MKGNPPSNLPMMCSHCLCASQSECWWRWLRWDGASVCYTNRWFCRYSHRHYQCDNSPQWQPTRLGPIPTCTVFTSVIIIRWWFSFSCGWWYAHVHRIITALEWNETFCSLLQLTSLICPKRFHTEYSACIVKVFAEETVIKLLLAISESFDGSEGLLC